MSECTLVTGEKSPHMHVRSEYVFAQSYPQEQPGPDPDCRSAGGTQRRQLDTGMVYLIVRLEFLGSHLFFSNRVGMERGG